jgi:hypothetical protein
MNREELRRILESAGVHPGNYSLYGPAKESESYSLVSNGADWSVLYKERGEFREIRGHLSEGDACQLIFRLLGEAHGFGG